jgi:tetratricopeptide (TPR) repeat protein
MASVPRPGQTPLKGVKQPSAKLLTIAASGLLLLATTALYAPAVGHEFVTYDDGRYIYENPHLRHGLSREGVSWALTSGYASNWHPLTWLSHLSDYELFGLDPAGPHAINVLLHATNAVLLFLALVHMTGRIGASFVVAALFAVHPLRVESVAWAAERKDVLSGLFWMLTLLVYSMYTRLRGWLRYALLLSVYAAGLMAKPMLVTLPVVLLLLDRWPLGRYTTETRLRCVAEKVPLLALAAGSSVITLLAQQRGGAVGTLPLLDRVVNAFLAWPAYLGKSLVPSGLAVFYPHPSIVYGPPSAVRIAAAIVAAAAVALMTWLAIRAATSRPYIAVGWLWYLVSLLPVVGLVQVGSQALADRYTYIPLIGIYLIVAWGGRELAERRPGLRVPLTVGAVAIVLTYALTSIAQLRHWTDSEALYERALAVTDRNFMAHSNLGAVLQKAERFAEAEQHYRSALRIHPDYPEANANLASLRIKQGDLEGAEALLLRALAGRPGHVEAHYNLALILAARGDADRAEAHYLDALEWDPACVECNTNLGVLYAQRGESGRAEEQFEQALVVDSTHVTAHLNMGQLCLRNGEADRALFHYEEALRLDPSKRTNPRVLASLASGYEAVGRPDEARAALRAALELAEDGREPALEERLRERLRAYDTQPP